VENENSVVSVFSCSLPGSDLFNEIEFGFSGSFAIGMIQADEGQFPGDPDAGRGARPAAREGACAPQKKINGGFY
jgi:hypothetical protein